MKILSLFDGMACGMLAFMDAEIPVDEYIAYEIEKNAVKTALHNFPKIQECGDVFQADFSKYKDFDFLIGGSPCTYWSIAQSPDKRETTASGIGWELFMQYVRALNEVKPRYFIYENNKSMSNAIRESITNTFGFEPICINSALVSAQNRKRLYWVGTKNEGGYYEKVKIEQSDDAGILLKDILESGIVEHDKAYCLKHQAGNVRDYFKKHHTDIKFYPTEPAIVSKRGRYSDTGNRTAKGNGKIEQYYEARTDSKSNCLTTVQKDNQVAQPIRVGCLPSPDGTIKNGQALRIYDVNGKSVNLTAQGGGMGGKTGLYSMRVPEATVKGYTEIEVGECVDLTQQNSKTRRGRKMSEKSNCLTTSSDYYQFIGTVNQKIYEVKNGNILINGKEYPIKLVDGFYIIRKLTVLECKRLQTVPDWYEFPCKDTPAYKMLGNGWTVKVISHLIKACMENEKEPVQLTFFDSIGRFIG